MSNPLLSRRSLLKASPALALAVAAPCSVAAAQRFIPEVLTMLLTEYRDAAANFNSRRIASSIAERAKCTALEKAALFVQGPDLGYHRLGETGRASHPQALAHMWRNQETDALAGCETAQERAYRRTCFKRARRALARQAKRYEAIVTASGFPAAQDAESDAYQRFAAAMKAVEAYPLATLAEVAAIAATCRKVGTFVGYANGFGLSNLADMLAKAGA